MLKQMVTHMRRWHGIGLAGPQVRCLEKLIVAEVDGEHVLWANPRILETGGMDRMEEGCLSLPGTYVDVHRPAWVWVQALNERNRNVDRKLEGLMARVVQHEIDHLQGMLIIDHGAPKTRDLPSMEQKL